LEEKMYYSYYQCPLYYNSVYGYRKEMGTQVRRAIAYLKGGPLAPGITGTVIFIEVPGGTEVSVEVNGLPPYKPAANGNPPVGPHGFHLHENGACDIGNPADPFTSAGGHWNPTNQPHDT
jgi:superoxide dismutase, Cu-Zn family